MYEIEKKKCEKEDKERLKVKYINWNLFTIPNDVIPFDFLLKRLHFPQAHFSHGKTPYFPLCDSKRVYFLDFQTPNSMSLNEINQHTERKANNITVIESNGTETNQQNT